jgi:hypothetical protein
MRTGAEPNCEHCGRHANLLYYGQPTEPAEACMPYGGLVFTPGDHEYACECGAQWHVDVDGELSMSLPHLVL